jgi:hypothetical protein
LGVGFLGAVAAVAGDDPLPEVHRVGFHPPRLLPI